jgi:HD domain
MKVEKDMRALFPSGGGTKLEDLGLALLRAESPYGAALENHCIRLAELSLALGANRGVELDEDLLRCATYLHDVGLCVKSPHEPNYLKRGLAFARPHVQRWGVGGKDLKVFEEVMLYSHSLRTVSGLTPQANLVRIAVAVEHSWGVLSHGLDPATRRSIFSRHERLDFNRVLWEFAKTTILSDGPSQLLDVFFPTPTTRP